MVNARGRTYQSSGSSVSHSPAARRRKRGAFPRWTSVLISIGAALTMISGGTLIAVQLGLAKLGSTVQQADLLGNTGAPAGGSARSIKGALNLLMVGLDTRPTGNIGSHTDTIIIAHIPASHDRAYLVSIPRDTSVDIPAYPKTNFTGGSYKISAAFNFGSLNGGGEAGGFQLLAQTIKQAYGITFDGALSVDFGGFQNIVKELGGVDMYIDETTTSIHNGYKLSDPKVFAKPYHIDPNTGVPICPTAGVFFDFNPLKCALPGTAPVQYKKGERHLTPVQALDFVRCRDGLVGTDYARQRHQQQFFKALLKEAYEKGMSDPLKAASFLKAIGKAFVFDGRGNPMTDWIFTLKSIGPSEIVTIKTNGGKTVQYTGPTTEDRQALNDDSLQLLRDLRDDNSAKDDKVGNFLTTHSSWVTQ